MNTTMRFKYILTSVLALAILVLLPVNTRAAEVIGSGGCGETLSWVLDSDGVLTVSGTGEMYDYKNDSPDWDDYYSSITAVVIEEGVTYLGDYAFFELPSLTQVTLSDTLLTIGERAFQGCSELTSITFPASITEISNRAFDSCMSMRTITFLGSAPTIGTYAFRHAIATVTIPLDDESWTEDVMKNYGGNLTWNVECETHVFGGYLLNGDATCTADGTKNGTCSICGAVVTVPDVGSRLPHSIPEYVSNNDATCTADGTKTGICEVCGTEETIDDPGTKQPHTFTNYISDNNATCTDGTETALCSFGCGLTHTRTEEGSADPSLHQYNEVLYRNPSCTISGLYLNVCAECHHTQISRSVPATGHTITLCHASEATCTTQGYTGDKICNVCGYTESTGEVIDYAAHTWDENQSNWVIRLSPTFSHSGIAVVSCTHDGCAATAERELPKLESDNPFTDVPESSYAYDAIMWAVREGITTGRSETRFVPADECLRAEIVTFLHRTIGQLENTDAMPFTDVKPSDFFYNHVIWAAKNGITTGVSDTLFAPYQACTRAQVVTFLWRASGCPVVSGSLPFRDVASGDYFYQAVLWAAQSGITTGTDAAHFSPNAACTRDQIVTFLYRCFASSDAGSSPVSG